MATFTPVDDDPFAPKTTPVEHDPFPPAAAANPHAYVPGQVAGFQIPGLATLDNATRVAQDAMTFGGADAATGKTARADTQSARDQLGPVGSAAADIAGYATGPGELGVGSGIAKLIGGRLLGRVAGSAGEGAGAAALGTVGHGDTDPADIGKAALVGGAVGGATGIFPGPKKTPYSPSTADLKSASDSAWQGPVNTPINPSDVGNALAQVHLNLTPGERAGMSGSLSSQLNNVARETSGSNRLSADDVAKFQKAIMKSARGTADQRVAGQFSDALDTALGPAKAGVDAANSATNTAKTSADIDKWMLDPVGAPSAVAGALAKKPGFYSNVSDALAPVAAYKNPTLGRVIAQRALQAGLGAGAGAAVGYAVGDHPIAGALAGAVHGPAIGHVVSAMRQVPILNALKAAKHLNATGDRLRPSDFSIPSPYATIPSDFLRQAGYAAGATGAF